MSFIFSGCCGEQPVTPKKHTTQFSKYDMAENNNGYYLQTDSSRKKISFDNIFYRKSEDFSNLLIKDPQTQLAKHSQICSTSESSSQRPHHRRILSFNPPPITNRESSTTEKPFFSSKKPPSRILPQGAAINSFNKQENINRDESSSSSVSYLKPHGQVISRNNFYEINHEVPICNGQSNLPSFVLYEPDCNHTRPQQL
mgnify:CR=1 FL=1